MTTPADLGTPNAKRDRTRIDTTTEAYDRMMARIQVCRDLMEGTEAIRRNAETYLPQMVGEDDDKWATRITLGALFNGFERTVLASVGMLSIHDPVLSDDTPKELVRVFENLDGAGTHGAVFATKAELRAIVDGHVGGFVDMPAFEPGMDLATANAQGIRPYAILVAADDEWLPFYEVIGGAKTLTMLVRRVERSVRVGRFGLAPRTEWWNYTLNVSGPERFVEYEMWYRDEDMVQPVPDSRFAAGPLRMDITRIPYARLIAGQEVSDVETRPALQSLADLNIEHHRTKNGILNLEELAFVPSQVRIGAVADKDGNYPPITLGPSSTIEAPYMQGVTEPVYWHQPDPAVIEPAMKTLASTEQAMEVSGQAFLAPNVDSVKTATAKRINAKAQNATLGQVGRRTAAWLTELMSFSAEWMGIDAKPVVTISTEFEDTTLDPTAMAAYVQAVQNAGLPPRILLAAWQKGGRIAADENLEELEREMLAHADAARAAKALDDAAAAAEADAQDLAA